MKRSNVRLKGIRLNLLVQLQLVALGEGGLEARGEGSAC